MCFTFNPPTAYSIVPELESAGLKGGAMLPAFLLTNISPGPDWVIHSRETRASEHATKNAAGFCPSASRRNISRLAGYTSF
jgi:hypothetical protein